MVLPKPIRDALGLEEGDALVIVMQQDGQALLATPERYASLTRGTLRGTWGEDKDTIERHLDEERASWETATR